MYIVTTKGRENMHLFLVDRTKIKDRWWSYKWDDAIIFQKLKAAQTQIKKLRYRSPEVITLNQAKLLTRKNDINNKL